MNPVFFVPEITSATITLGEEEAMHASRVLRLKKGDYISLTCGDGFEYTCTIHTLDKKNVEVVVHEKEWHVPQEPTIHLLAAPTKSMDRTEWLLEKAVECGIQSFTPLLCDHSERKSIKKERLCKIAIAAMKQSRQFHLPAIRDLISFEAALATLDTNTLAMIAHCRDEKIPFVGNVLGNQTSSFSVMIGPEGDFSEAEVSAAVQAGVKGISLGPTRLRTETAGIMSVMVIRSIHLSLAK